MGGNVSLPARSAVPLERSASAPAGFAARARDWLALTKPGITALIVTVGIAGYLACASSPIALVPLGLLVLFGASASGGAAMLNHYFDRDLDARMRRTRERPLPGGRLARDSDALAGGLLLSALGVGGAAVWINPLTGVAIFLGGATYVGLYTIWLKRRSSWNIVLGGFAGSAPALAGGAAATGHFPLAAVALALLLFCWTPPHFWSLALLLRSDYERAGLPMLPDMHDPLRSGRVVVLSAAALLPPTFLLWLWAPEPLWAGAALVGLGAIFVALTAPLWRAPVRTAARRGFIYSGIYLLAFLAVVVAAALLAHPALGWSLVR
jgi:protoheme IX farnesyltransferase